MISLIIIVLLWASPALADPKNYLPQSETPVAARCVTADGLSYESCGGSLTLNGADGAINDGANDTIKATVKDYTNSNPLATILVDTNGDPASVGGGTQYSQGTASTDTDTMTMAGCVRVDTPAVATGVIDGDRARCMIDSTGRLWVHVGVIDGTVAVTQSGTWNITTLTGITNPVAVTGTFWQATQPVSAASLPLPTGAATAANQDGIIKDGTGDTTQANVSSGNLHVAVQGTATVSGTVTVTDGAGALNVICDSGCSGGTQYDEDTVHASGDKLTMAGVVRKDANAALAADGDNTVLQVDANGYLKVVNINPNLAADNSTLSTAKVPVLPGTVSTSAPTWTNGNQSALSLQTDGSVRAAITNTPTVTANAGTNLNTSALLTTSAHDAAFGTAGSADAQVRTVQGIASMTPLQVQSNSASLATEASVDGLEGGLGGASDAAATAGSTGSVTAKLRLMTSQLDTISTAIAAIQTATQLIDDDQTGASMHHRVSVGTTEDEHEIKGSAGRLFSINVTNTNAAVRYLRCANQVIGSTTPGTTTVWYGMAIPGATTGAGYTANFGPSGVAFSTGLTCWIVTGAAETDVAEVAANEINVNYTYK